LPFAATGAIVKWTWLPSWTLPPPAAALRTVTSIGMSRVCTASGVQYCFSIV
jgi:hypothetical protein